VKVNMRSRNAIQVRLALRLSRQEGLPEWEALRLVGEDFPRTEQLAKREAEDVRSRDASPR
jgi:hypothetical protein